ncbi:YVTN family beta-propeller protein [Arcicella rosea]|uniref:YncE family protein n=1 Tax=Arcicella rosea TaxID=502909 RepID=UPI00345D3BA6
MKKIIIPIFTLMLGGCISKTSEVPQLNINYPAAYVVNGESSTISIINLNINEVADLIQLTDDMSGMAHGANAMFLQYPHHIYLNPSKSQIAIAAPGADLSQGHGTTASHSGGAKVAVLNASSGINVKLIDVPMMNHNAIYTTDGKEIWTSQMDEAGKILVYDATTYTLKNTISVGKEPAEITFSNDGTTAFVANGMDNTVTAINPNTKTILATIPVGMNPVGAWTGSDNRMYVDNEEGQTVSIIDVKTLKVVETIALGFMPGFVAYQGGMKEMWVTDPMAGKVHWWTKDATGKMVYTGAFATAAGSHAIAFKDMMAYVTNQEAANVSVIDVMQHKVTKTIAVGKKPNGIVIR